MDLIQMLERRDVPGERTVAHEDNSAAICSSRRKEKNKMNKYAEGQQDKLQNE